jgi:hypothetical protein
MKIKKCPRCNETDKAKFRVRKSGQLYSWCNRCVAAASAEWRIRNPEKMKIYLENQAKKQAEWRVHNPNKAKYYRKNNTANTVAAVAGH